MSRNLVFGGVEVRPDERSLVVDGSHKHLGARAFDVLVALVERRERVVTKNELLDIAWPGLVVEENNLSVQISTLRRVLGNQAIATIAGRGYQFSLAATGKDTDSASAGIFPALDDRILRRLAAIAFADVIGWSQLVEADARAAVLSWKTTRANVIEPNVPIFGGRLIELTPERLFVEFPSAVDAVRWAVDLQARLTSRRKDDSSNQIRMRVGINVEDFIVDEGRVIGEGVNIAASIQQSATDEEIIVTGSVRDLVSHKTSVHYQPLGERQARNLDRPLSLFKVVPGSEELNRPWLQPHLMWDYRPTVAVLPFGTEGGDADSYFGDGITEEIIASVSLNRSLFVIARNSTLRYKNASVSTRQVAAELGVRYVLTGQVRRAAKRLRINVELVDAAADRVIWSERYKGGDDDVFGFQAQIAASIAGAIDPFVKEAEVARIRGTDSFSAYDCVLRGSSMLFNFRPEQFDLAGDYFKRAIELDPTYAQAHAHLAWWYNFRVGEGRTSDFAEDTAQADELSLRAVQLDRRDAWILSVAGHIQSFLKKRYTAALDLFDQALELNPNCTSAWARSATTLAYLGRGEDSLSRVRNAIRLSPFDPETFAFFTTNGTAAFVIGRYDEAIGWLGKARRLNMRYKAALRLMIGALALSGEIAEADELALELLGSEPDFSVRRFGSWYPLKEPHLGKLLEGLRLAGLPA